LAETDATFQSQQLFTSHEGLVGSAVGRKIARDGCERIDRRVAVRSVAEIQQVTAPCILLRVGVQLKTKSPEAGCCLFCRAVIAPANNFIHLRRGGCRGESAKICESDGSFSPDIHLPRRWCRARVISATARPSGKPCQVHVEQTAFVVNGESIASHHISMRRCSVRSLKSYQHPVSRCETGSGRD